MDRTAVSFEKVGDLTFNMARTSVVSLLGRPEVYINELFAPGIMIDKYPSLGLEIYYDIRGVLTPFAIEFTKKAIATIDGEELFRLRFSEVKNLVESVWLDDFEVMPLARSKVRNREMLLCFAGEELTDGSRLFSVTLHRKNCLELFEKRRKEPRELVALSGEEMDRRYKHLTTF